MPKKTKKEISLAKEREKNSSIISFPDKAKERAMSQLKEENERLKREQKEFSEMAVRAILQALDCKDSYTYGHSMRVTYYSLLLGKEIGLDKEELYTLELASLFHDIGKIGIPDSILLKPSRLDEKEFRIMISHPLKSFEILSKFTPFKKVAKYAKHHHERYDGRGYPDALKGDNIPLFSRIILIADTFDAMTSTRPYRKALPRTVAFKELEEFSGTQFDPNLLKHFMKAMSRQNIKNENTFTLTIIDGEFEKEAA